MPAPALAAVASLEVVLFGEDHQSVFEIIIFAFFQFDFLTHKKIYSFSIKFMSQSPIGIPGGGESKLFTLYSSGFSSSIVICLITKA